MAVLSLRQYVETQLNLHEVSLGCESLADMEVPHDHKAGQVGKRDFRLVSVSQSELVCLLESASGNRLDPQEAGFFGPKNSLAKLPRGWKRTPRKEAGYSLIKHVVRSH
jgi:hypothetical protein